MKELRYYALLLLLMPALWCQADDYEQKRRYDVCFLDAMMQRQKGNHDAAFHLLLHCREIKPDASEVSYFLGQYYSEMKMHDEALACFQKACLLEPANTTYMETLAQAYIAKEDYTRAAETMEQLYAADKSRQDLLETIYRLYLQLRSYDKAIEVLNRMEAIDGKSERISLAKSGLYIQMDDQEKALKEIRELSDQYPNDLNYRTLYANTLMMNEEREEAYEVLRAILQEEPNNYRAQLSLRTYYQGEEDEERADSLTRSILLNPVTSIEDKISLMRQEIGQSEASGGDSTRVMMLFHELLAQPEPSADMAEFCAAYMSLKKMPRDSIRQMLEFVLQLAPDNASARLQLVQYAWEDDNDDQVVSLCQAARQYNPDEMAFYYYQGMSYFRKDDRDHALEAFQNGISVITDESNPAIASDFYAIMGDLLHQKNRVKEAFAAYDSCLQWKPDNISCLNNYAYYLSELGIRLDEAETMSFKTIKAEPKNATYLDTYAWILFMQERYQEARIYIDQTLQNDTTASTVLLEHAGDIYAQCGELETALKYWQQALDADADSNTPSDKARLKTLQRKIKRKKYIK
jgi:tetratricopeptide (TPR) repeat protein